jgi:hypothetical protein
MVRNVFGSAGGGGGMPAGDCAAHRMSGTVRSRSTTAARAGETIIVPTPESCDAHSFAFPDRYTPRRMPMPPLRKVNYDFVSADELSRALSQLSEKIKWLIWVRESTSGKLFNCGEKSWTGAKHDLFVKELTAQHRTLHALAEEAIKLKHQVDQATKDATDKLRSSHA